MSDQEVKINLNVKKDDDNANAEQSAEAQAVAAETVKADAEVAKLGADLEELRQTLLRRQADFDNYRKGFKLIYKQLLESVTRLGAERLDPVGKSFDPHLHQAVDRAETSDHADGTILQVFQPGYVFHGRVLRPAMVRVAVHPNPASKEAVN